MTRGGDDRSTVSDPLLAVARRGPRQAVRSPSAEAESGRLAVLEWRGNDDERFFRRYRERFGDHSIDFVYVRNTEDSIRRLRDHRIRVDLVHPEIGHVVDFVNLGLVQPFDPELIPNIETLHPALLERGRVDGEQYHVPIDWGFVAPLVNRAHVDVGPEDRSYRLLFDERHAGRIAWFDTPWMLVIAGYVLGVGDPWDMSDEELERSERLLAGCAHLVHSLWTDQVELDLLVARGEVWIAYAWNQSFKRGVEAGLDLDFVVDVAEGPIVWTEGFVLMADTENYHHGHAFVDAWASEQTAHELARVWLGHANIAATKEALSPEVGTMLALVDPSEAREPKAHIDRYIPRRALYTEVWERVKPRL